VSAFIVIQRVRKSTITVLPATKRRVADCAKILLDIAKESADWFPLLKSALGGVNAVIKHYEVFVRFVAIARD
jgi:hypothetical protein